ncbi:hypothetical protein [Streptomyces flavofungini]|uniref:hypothetical protein n=1 Tax=Streptomyces flavofungini TaxID=68200 RepID=UPI0025AFB51D|nr:hypothetical protein [Streptomyces flavofungini]WJV47523.1 hypothetical protein QUY26_19515 [Streptomyces flavofungini]
MIIVDAQHLFIDNEPSSEHSEPDAGWHVTDCAVVAWARSVYEMFWWRATRWQDLDPAAREVTSTDFQRRILRELETGCSQQQVARRLSPSVYERAVHKALASSTSSRRHRSPGAPETSQVLGDAEYLLDRPNLVHGPYAHSCPRLITSWAWAAVRQIFSCGSVVTP